LIYTSDILKFNFGGEKPLAWLQSNEKSLNKC